MGIELFDEPGIIAGLNLYASTANAFDDDTVEAAMLFAIQAAHTLGRVMTQKQLTDAMRTRTTIAGHRYRDAALSAQPRSRL